MTACNMYGLSSACCLQKRNDAGDSKRTKQTEHKSAEAEEGGDGGLHTPEGSPSAAAVWEHGLEVRLKRCVAVVMPYLMTLVLHSSFSTPDGCCDCCVLLNDVAAASAWPGEDFRAGAFECRMLCTTAIAQQNDRSQLRE